MISDFCFGDCAWFFFHFESGRKHETQQDGKWDFHSSVDQGSQFQLPSLAGANELNH
jgi:hypothetical protein